MTDAPFSPFTPLPPPTPMFEGEVSGKKTRKKRAKKEPKAAKKSRRQITGVTITSGGSGALPKAEVHTAPIPTRRKARKPRPTMIPIGILPALGGLQEAETSMLMSIIGNMQDAPKKSRTKIVAALAKVFA